jgi:hypothetical protein
MRKDDDAETPQETQRRLAAEAEAQQQGAAIAATPAQFTIGELVLNAKFLVATTRLDGNDVVTISFGHPRLGPVSFHIPIEDVDQMIAGLGTARDRVRPRTIQ